MTEYFAAYPAVQALRWRQYTPYFNDGDDCSFTLQDIYLKFADTPEGSGDYEDGFATYEAHDDEAVLAAYKAADQLWASEVMAEVLLRAYGDHAMVTAHNKGFIEVVEYDHD